MQIRDTREDFEVESILQWSRAQKLVGKVVETAQWDKFAPRRNSRFQEVASGRQWVVYQAEGELPAEVRVLEPGA